MLACYTKSSATFSKHYAEDLEAYPQMFGDVHEEYDLKYILSNDFTSSSVTFCKNTRLRIQVQPCATCFVTPRRYRHYIMEPDSISRKDPPIAGTLRATLISERFTGVSATTSTREKYVKQWLQWRRPVLQWFKSDLVCIWYSFRLC